MEKKRGRKSAAEPPAMRAVSNNENVFPIKKPRAPKSLTSEQQKIWDSVIKVHGQDWLSNDQRPILIQYCRHTITARRISQLIQEEEGRKEAGFEIKYYLSLLRAQESESRAISALARSLRITNQARYQSTNAGIRPDDAEELPWEFK